MRHKLLLIVAVTSTCFAMSSQTLLQNTLVQPDDGLVSIASIGYQYPRPVIHPEEIKNMLAAASIPPAVMNKVLTTLECAKLFDIEHTPILTLIDYSQPSNAKRLWIFNLQTKQVLFNTYVSHGIKSGSLLTTNFSNKQNSKSSSMGIYLTDKAYRGREGMSLKLTGLDRGFNDNAADRAIVMHGGWYMEDAFIKKYGRAGRSWGCPAVPADLSDSIINTIKNNSLVVVYYPSDSWFEQSKFLNCHRMSPIKTSRVLHNEVQAEHHDERESVLFANVKIKHGESDPVVTMPADYYEQTFHNKAPLTRMLRRQIDHMEYIALSATEFKTIISNAMQHQDKQAFNQIYFVVPQLKMDRGYYKTEMKIVDLGKVQDIQVKPNTHPITEEPSGFTVFFDGKSPITLRTNNQFIRWLGL
jgi:hypothetical protein